MRWLIIISALFLTACAGGWEPQAGEHRLVKVHIVTEGDMLREFFNSGNTLPPGQYLRGFALFGGPICQVFVTPKTAQTQTLNHEIRHCFEGNFHK